MDTLGNDEVCSAVEAAQQAMKGRKP